MDTNHPASIYTPTSIADRSYWQALAAHPAAAPLVQQILAQCDTVTATYPPLTASQILATRRHNNRDPGDDHWHELRFFGLLVARRCILGMDENDPDDRLLNWLFAMATEPTWVATAHLPKHDLPAFGVAQTDLAATEMAGELAETVEILAPWINAQSQTLVSTIIAEIDRRILTPFAENPAVAWWGDTSEPVSNWNGVCGGSVFTACQALERMGYPRPQARKNAMEVLHRYFAKGFTPAGECDEGVAYWSYGMRVACHGLQSLSLDELEQDFDMNRLKQVVSMLGRAHLYGNTFFAGNDSSTSFHTIHATAPWLVLVTQDEFLRRWCAQQPIGIDPRNMQSILRSLAWAPVAQQIKDEAQQNGGSQKQTNSAHGSSPRVQELPDQQAIIARRDSAAGELIVTLSGGDNAERHNHNDLGHFMVALGEKMVIPDLGSSYYTADFFGPKRYTYLSTSSRGHCCPVINQQEQRDGKEAAGRIVEKSVTSDAIRFVLDLTSAYPAEAQLKRWHRALVQTDEGFGIEDEYQLKQEGAIEHVIWFVNKPEINDAQLRVDGLCVKLNPPPSSVHIEPIDPREHRLRTFTENTQLYRIVAKYAVGSGLSLRVRTDLSAE